MNILNDEAALRSLVEEANTLQRHLQLRYNNIEFDIRKPKRLVEGKAGKWVIYQPSWASRSWTYDEFAQHLQELRDLAAQRAEQVQAAQRMDELNARVRMLLGDEDYKFYTHTLIGYGSPRG